MTTPDPLRDITMQDVRLHIGEWQPTHRHKKRGSEYQVITKSAQLQSAMPIDEPMQMTVYRDEGGRYWVRPSGEFNDGRFEALPTPPARAADQE